MKSVFNKFEINAVGDSAKINALCYQIINEEFIRWVAREGMDVNHKDVWVQPPRILSISKS